MLDGRTSMSKVKKETVQVLHLKGLGEGKNEMML